METDLFRTPMMKKNKYENGNSSTTPTTTVIAIQSSAGVLDKSIPTTINHEHRHTPLERERDVPTLPTYYNVSPFKNLNDKEKKKRRKVERPCHIQRKFATLERM